MKPEYTFITLRDRPELMNRAAAWFHEKWRVPQEAYLECMVQGIGEPEMTRMYIHR